MYLGTAIPMGQGDAETIGHGQGRADSGNHLEGYIVLREGLRFFPAPTEEKGVSALEPDNPFSLAGFSRQKAVDFALGKGVPSRLISHIDGLRRRREQRQHPASY
jgi:hypothetical protein